MARLLSLRAAYPKHLIQQSTLKGFYLRRMKQLYPKSPLLGLTGDMWDNSRITTKRFLMDPMEQNSSESGFDYLMSSSEPNLWDIQHHELSNLAVEACQSVFNYHKSRSGESNGGNQNITTNGSTYRDILPSDINHIVCSSTTYHNCPPFDREIRNAFNLGRYTTTDTILNYGCASGAMMISSAMKHLKAHPTQAVLMCTADAGGTQAWNHQFKHALPKLMSNYRVLCEDPRARSIPLSQSFSKQVEDAEYLIKTLNVVHILLGDLAYAGVIVGPQHRLANSGQYSHMPKVVSSKTLFVNPEEVASRKSLVGSEMTREGYYEMYLKPEIPYISPKPMFECAKAVLDEMKITFDDLKVLAIHPGGPKVITEFLKLSAKSGSKNSGEDHVKYSFQSLEENGNCISGSVLDTLRRAIEDRKPKLGDSGLVLAVGPDMRWESVGLKW